VFLQCSIAGSVKPGKIVGNLSAREQFVLQYYYLMIGARARNQGPARAAGQRLTAPTGSRYVTVSAPIEGGRCLTIKRRPPALQRQPAVSHCPP
jgi:hypothetical protein